MKDVYTVNIMSTDVKTVESDTPIVEAAGIMSQNDIGSVIVTDTEARLKGILTDADIVDAVAVETPMNKVKAQDEATTTNLITATRGEHIEQISRKMKEENVKKLPVVGEDGETIVGIVTTTDITKYIPEKEVLEE